LLLRFTGQLGKKVAIQDGFFDTAIFLGQGKHLVIVVVPMPERLNDLAASFAGRGVLLLNIQDSRIFF